MHTIKLLRTTSVSGTTENVVVKCDVIVATSDWLTVKVTEDVLSELKEHDWRSGDFIDIPRNEISATKSEFDNLLNSVIS